MRPLGDFVRLLSGNTPSKADETYWNGDTPWISAKDMGNFWIEDSEDHLTPAGVSAASKLVSPGTVLLLTRGMTLHKRVPICRTAKAATFNQDVKAVLPREELSARFLPYLLVGNHDRLHERVDVAGHGTGRLNTDALLAFPVWVPAPLEQAAIASIGEALDDRLRLLRKTNATLEAIAQALFKSWFIDFDPVRAKMAGRAPEGMDEATAALFPDALVETQLGVVPESWQLMRLASAFEVNPSRPLKKGVLAPYLDMASVATSGHRTDSPLIRELGSGAKFCNGDTLLARITPCLENGKAAFVDFLADQQIGWGSTEFLVMRPKGSLPDYFAYLLCKHQPFLDFAVQSMAGTSGRQRIQNEALGRYPIAVPPDTVGAAFGQLVSPIQCSIAVNDEKAKTLATMRDTLLPRLISGQLRLPEAQAFATELTTH